MRRLLPLFAAAVAAFAQAPAQQPPIFRTEANYVRVDAFPTRDGQPLLDLTQDEFEVLEDGVPQKIDAFEHVVVRPAGPQDLRHEPNTVAESRAALDNPRARVFVVFLDFYHVDVSGSHNIRKPLIDTLNKVIGQEDLVGVMTPEMSALDVTFARRTTTIEGLLTRYWHWGERNELITKDPREAQYAQCYPGFGPTQTCPDDDRGIAQEMVDRRREKLTIDALEDLVRFLRGAREERKAVLVITDGWRLYAPNRNLARRLNCSAPSGAPPLGVDPRTGKLGTTTPNNPYGGSMYECERDRMNLANTDDANQFRQILDEANRANTSFYPIDPRGLVVFDEPIVPRDVTGNIQPMTPPSVDAARLRTRLESLRTLAGATDGIAIVDSNDLARGLKRVVDDLTSYYLLGYYSTGKLDGRFHSIKVRVRRPGVEVRARRGYLAATAAEVNAARAAAVPPDPAALAAAAEARAIDAVVAPLSGLSRDLPVRLRIAAGWKPDKTAGVWAVGEIGASEDWRGGGEVDVVLSTAAGSTLASAHVAVEPGTRSFRVALSPAEPPAPGEYTVRVRGRSVSPIALPVNEVARFTFAALPAATGAILFRRGASTGNKDMPTADVRFRRSDQIRAEVPMAAGAVAARLLDRTGKPLSVPVVAAAREDADGSRWATAQLALAPLAPGDYVIEIANGQDGQDGSDRSGGSGRSGGPGGPGGSGRETRRTLVAFRLVP